MATAYRWTGELDNEEIRSAPAVRKSARPTPQLVQPAAKLNGTHKKPVIVESYTVKKIDNSRLVRNIEPVKLKNFYKTAGLGVIIAIFCMFYVYQHFRCIDLSFQLEDLKAKQQQAQALNSALRLEIATLRDPHRIDVIARHQLGLTQPTALQVREYANLDGAEVAAAQYPRSNRAP